MTGPASPGLTELGIATSDGDLLEAARGETVIAQEAAARQNAQRPRRQRLGPLPVEKRGVVVGEAVEMLSRATLVLLLGCSSVNEVNFHLARAGLQLRVALPDLDVLAETLRKKF